MSEEKRKKNGNFVWNEHNNIIIDEKQNEKPATDISKLRHKSVAESRLDAHFAVQANTRRKKR